MFSHASLCIPVVVFNVQHSHSDYCCSRKPSQLHLLYPYGRHEQPLSQLCRFLPHVGRLLQCKSCFCIHSKCRIERSLIDRHPSLRITKQQCFRGTILVVNYPRFSVRWCSLLFTRGTMKRRITCPPLPVWWAF